MRILLCAANLDPAAGGPAQSVPQLARALADLGHQVALWSPVPPPPPSPSSSSSSSFSSSSSPPKIEDRRWKMEDGERRTEVGVRSPPSAPAPPSDLRPPSSDLCPLVSSPVVSSPVVFCPGSFADALAAFGRPDVVHDNGLWLPCHHQVAQACARHRLPRVVSPRGMLEPWALRQRRWKKRLAWFLYQRRDLHAARLLHATSVAERDQLRQLGLHQPAVILPNGVAWPESISMNRSAGLPARLIGGDCSPTDQAEVQNSKSNSNSSSTPETRTALFLSRLHPKKGLELLVEAWARVRPAGWRMRVVGPDAGGYRQKIMAAVSRAGLSDLWTFENMADGTAKWRWLAAAELFILPSFSENFGIVVAEALVAGVPVITTTATPWAGLLEHRCGWWTEPTVDGITAALREAVALPPDDLRAMGRRGAAWARTEFHWPAIARTMAEAYLRTTQIKI